MRKNNPCSAFGRIAIGSERYMNIWGTRVAFKKLTHFWIKIAGPSNSVDIDPWPTGGAELNFNNLKWTITEKDKYLIPRTSL